MVEERTSTLNEVAVDVEITIKVPPFIIKRLVQPYQRPDNVALATQRITEDIALTIHHQLTHLDRKKWPDYDRVVVPVPGTAGRYRLYGQGFYKDEGTEISWTGIQEQEIAQTLGYGDLPPWNDMPTDLPHILYPPGSYTEETLRLIRGEEREKQKQADEAHRMETTAVGKEAALREAESNDRLTNKPRPRGVKISGLGKKPVLREAESNDGSANKPQPRGVKITGLGKKPVLREEESKNGRPANKPRPRGVKNTAIGKKPVLREAESENDRPAKKPHGVKITGAGKKPAPTAKNTGYNDLGEGTASDGFDGSSGWGSESSEEYTPFEDSGESEWEEDYGSKKGRATRTQTKKQQETGNPKTRSHAVADESASMSNALIAASSSTFEEDTELLQPNPLLETDDGSCVKCKTSTGGDMVTCDGNHDVEAWFHIQCVGLDKTPGEDENWICDDCVADDKVSPESTPGLAPAALGSKKLSLPEKHSRGREDYGSSPEHGGKGRRYGNARRFDTRGASNRQGEDQDAKDPRRRKGRPRVNKRQKLEKGP